MTSYDERLHMFRMKMKEKGITHYFQKLSDPHITEYVHPYYKRIEWLCGFSGSNATIVVTQDSALLWTDPRYYLQGSKQLPPSWTLKRAYDLGVPSPSKFIASSGEFVLGLDTYTTSYSMISEIYDNNESVKLFDYDIFSDLNPSPLELTKVVEFNASFLSVKDKIDLIRKRYDKGTIVLTALDDVAWVFNIRGSDIPFTPVTYAFAIINPQGSYLFVGDKHQTEQIQQFKSFEGANVTVHSYNSFFKTFQQYITGPHLYYSEAYTNLHLLDMIVSYKEQMILKSELNYLQIQKSIRHPQEIKTLINLHNIDSLALCKFYAQIESMKGSTKTEWELCELLEDIRKEYEFYDGPSFESIIATGPNAAIIHYEPTSDKCSIVNWESTLLCDVGGQYKNGATTDVTRTVHFGTPTQK
ncbi:Xaa-pro aminopeptidase [Entamoeba marina]